VIGVLDANVLIAFLDSGDDLHERAVSLLKDHAASDLMIGELTLAEVLVGPVRREAEEVVLAAVRALAIDVVPLGDAAQPASVGTALALARLRRETGLKMPDCCVLLIARQRGAQVLTFDERLARAAAAA
jgi:predicted nucleic acid-binding protein